MQASPAPLNTAAPEAPAHPAQRAPLGPSSAWMPDHAWHYRSEGFAEDLDEGSGAAAHGRPSLLRRAALPLAVLVGVVSLAALVALL